MPLTEKKYFSRSNLSLGLWHITESLDELVDILEVNDIDLSYLENIGHEKKKKEFLASRIVIKQLLTFYEKPYKGVIKDDILKPYLVGSKYHVSLSHSHEYAAAVIHPENKTAIDIELVSQKLQNIAHKFLNPEEAAFCQDDLSKITLLWCAKETLYKVFHGRGLIFKDNLFVTSFPIEDEGIMETEIRLGSQTWKYKMPYMIVNGYGLTFIEDQI